MDRVQVLDNLIDAFGLGHPDFHGTHRLRHYEEKAMKADAVTIGCEVEVRFSSYFPELYAKYLEDTSFEELSNKQKLNFTAEINELEPMLQADLAKSEAAGVPKGKDRYYEFANLPVYHPYTLTVELSLLRDAGLIPKGIKHPLHITIGGLGHSQDVGYMLMTLELLGYTSPARIWDVAVSNKAVTWARKGRAGMRERSAAELSLGATKAIELRTLELPETQRGIEELFGLTHKMATIICGKGTDLDVMRLARVWEELAEIGHVHDIDVYSNWGRPYDNPQIWIDFANKLPNIDTTVLKELVNEL
jgi:hypothetical protein